MFNQILAAVDLDHSDNAEKILQIAVDIANTYTARLQVVSVIGAVQQVVSQYLPEGYEEMAMKGGRLSLLLLGLGGLAVLSTLVAAALSFLIRG